MTTGRGPSASQLMGPGNFFGRPDTKILYPLV